MRRVGVLPPTPSLEEAHGLILGLLEPDQMYQQRKEAGPLGSGAGLFARSD